MKLRAGLLARPANPKTVQKKDWETAVEKSKKAHEKRVVECLPDPETLIKALAGR